MFKVDATDRKYQIWERNPLSVSLWSQPVFKQKIEYSFKPDVAGVCRFPEDYKYSSASFYVKAATEWHFLTHYHV